MFSNEQLQQHLETSSSINSQPLVIAEWNMNVAENIKTVGNYRHRPTATASDDDFVYATPLNTFDVNDANNEIKFYTGATDADVVIDGGLDNNDQPIAFVQPNEKERLLFSLEECFKRFRPRSGINKLRYFEDNYTHFVNNDLANRPRYYMGSRNDSFKYWTSYRKENGIERGIANNPVGALYYIDDAAPFISYKESVPANRVVVKMQTNVGDVDLGPFLSSGSAIEDPFYGESNKTVPNNWSIQILKNNSWIDIVSFNPLSVRADGAPVVGSDGYVEISYGIILPDEYRNTIHFAGRYAFESLLPVNPPKNNAYFVQQDDNELGMVYVWNGESYDSFVPNYGWFLHDETVSEQTQFVTNFVNPEYFVDETTGETKYKEFEYIDGIRVVVKTMNKPNSTFDLLELSPRLTSNITDRVSEFSVNKSASDLGVSGMPVGQLLASNGSLEIFDFDDAFNKNNTDSVLSSFTSNNLQVKMFEIIYDFSNDVVDSYHVPIKTMYADGFPESASNTRKFSLQLRDLFFYFESLNAPQLLVENASLSYAVSFLLDSIGFSNYTFRRVEGEDDPIIPYFFVKPETSIAQTLQELAVATQTAMFFDEYNNFVMMSKNYMMPSVDERATDTNILGSLDQEKSGIVENSNTSNKLSNIIELSSRNQEVFNDGKITFEEKYIAKTYGSLKEASYVNQDQNWIYKPALLWEVAGTPPLRSLEGSQETTSSYTLAAVPLNSDLSDVVPYVQNNQIQNNVIDFGEGAYWVARYSGYFYANGEIIKYDAIEHSVSGIGNVWISSLREYQNYFSKIRFGGKIYPTGRVRIYAEPFYEEINGITIMTNGPVRKHGRAQFGTSVAYHNAGLSQYWSDTSVSAPVRGIEMDSSYLFSTPSDSEIKGVYNQSSLSFPVSLTIQEPGQLSSVAYGNSKWVGVGSDGIFRTSINGTDWTSFEDAEFTSGFNFKSVAYGSGPDETSIWIAVGEKTVGENKEAAMAYSEDGESWTEIALTLSFDSISKIAFANNLWMIVGSGGGIATSADGEVWEEKTSRLDYTVFGSNKAKILSRTYQKSGSTAATFKVSRHGLANNDAIRIVANGDLPDGILENTIYYVTVVDKDNIRLSESEGGSLISFVSEQTKTLHKIERFVKTRINSLFYGDGKWVVVGNNGSVSYSTDTNEWIAVNASFDSSTVKDIHYGMGLWVAVGASGKLRVSSNLSSWSKKDSKISKQLTSVYYSTQLFGLWVIGGQEGKLATSVDANKWKVRDSKFGSVTINEIRWINNQWLAIGDKLQVSTSTSGFDWTDSSQDNFGEILFTTETPHSFTPFDTIVFSTNGSFPEDSVEEGERYYVTPKNISEYQFTIAAARDDARSGNVMTASGSQSGTHFVSLYTVPDLIENIDISKNVDGYVLVEAPTTQLQVGDRVFFGVKSGNDYIEKQISGGLTRYAPFYVHTIINSSSMLVSQTLSGLPVIHNDNVVDLEDGESFCIILNLTEEILRSTFISPYSTNVQINNLLEISKGTGELIAPTRVSAVRAAIQVNKTISNITIDSPALITSTNHGLFNMDIITFTTTGTLPHGIDSGIEYYVQKVNANSFTLLDKELERVVTSDGEGFRTQSGTHSFVKSLNDKAKIVLNRKTGEEVLQYLSSVEDVLVDSEDGETESQTVFKDISDENVILITQELEVTKFGKAGFSDANNELARSASRNGIIKNYLTKSSFSETDVNKFLSTQTGTIQSSAMVFNGPSLDFDSEASQKQPLDFVSYAYKEFDNKYSHFGTRMRIVGRIGQEEREQILYNSLNYFLNPEASLDEQFSIYGGSGGIGVMVNPETNVGYYFEIMALSQSNVAEYSEDVGLFNVVFYKVVRKVSSGGEELIVDSSKAIPLKLWQGITNVVADDGTMVGQFRMANESNPSVYDIAVEYEDIDENNRKFYLMINNKIIAVVDDTDPLPIHNSMSLFVRGGTRAMFENIYALANNYSQNTVFELDPPVNSVFGVEKIDVSQSFRKYALSGAVQSTYLSGISSIDIPKQNIYYEEFGTIMRECAYFNIRYDKAYPALYAKISETFNKMKGYTVSGFVPSAYGAEFLVFNNTDTALNLDETSGNYLRIQGVTFTQSTGKELSVDDYFDRVSNFADPDITEDGTIISPVRAKQDYLDIKNSRTTYGRKEFNISSSYIQSEDEANNLMGWMISKIMKPRKSIGIKMFAMPTLQLGDIVTIDYQSNDSIEQISNKDSRFVVYNIEYSRDSNGPSMNVFLSEVI